MCNPCEALSAPELFDREAPKPRHEIQNLRKEKKKTCNARPHPVERQCPGRQLRKAWRQSWQRGLWGWGIRVRLEGLWVQASRVGVEAFDS